MIVEIYVIKQGVNKNGKSTKCKCDYCGKEFKRRFSYVINSKNHFCDINCKVLWERKNKKGKNNPLYSRVEVQCQTVAKS